MGHERAEYRTLWSNDSLEDPFSFKVKDFERYVGVYSDGLSPGQFFVSRDACEREKERCEARGLDPYDEIIQRVKMYIQNEDREVIVEIDEHPPVEKTNLLVLTDSNILPN